VVYLPVNTYSQQAQFPRVDVESHCLTKVSSYTYTSGANMSPSLLDQCNCNPEGQESIEGTCPKKPEGKHSPNILEPTRLLSCFRRGFLTILAAVIKGEPIPTGDFMPHYSPAPG